MNVETLIYKNDHNPNPAVSSNEAHFRVSREFLRLLQTENFECFFFLNLHVNFRNLRNSYRCFNTSGNAFSSLHARPFFKENFRTDGRPLKPCFLRQV